MPHIAALVITIALGAVLSAAVPMLWAAAADGDVPHHERVLAGIALVVAVIGYIMLLDVLFDFLGG